MWSNVSQTLTTYKPTVVISVSTERWCRSCQPNQMLDSWTAQSIQINNTGSFHRAATTSIQLPHSREAKLLYSKSSGSNSSLQTQITQIFGQIKKEELCGSQPHATATQRVWLWFVRHCICNRTGLWEWYSWCQCNEGSLLAMPWA